MRDRVKGVGGGSLGSSVPLHVTSHPPHGPKGTGPARRMGRVEGTKDEPTERGEE